MFTIYIRLYGITMSHPHHMSNCMFVLLLFCTEKLDDCVNDWPRGSNKLPKVKISLIYYSPSSLGEGEYCFTCVRHSLTHILTDLSASLEGMRRYLVCCLCKMTCTVSLFSDSLFVSDFSVSVNHWLLIFCIKLHMV